MKNLTKRTNIFLMSVLLGLSLLLTACPAPTEGGATDGGAAPTDTTTEDAGATDTTTTDDTSQ